MVHRIFLTACLLLSTLSLVHVWAQDEGTWSQRLAALPTTESIDSPVKAHAAIMSATKLASVMGENMKDVPEVDRQGVAVYLLSITKATVADRLYNLNVAQTEVPGMVAVRRAHQQSMDSVTVGESDVGELLLDTIARVTPPLNRSEAVDLACAALRKVAIDADPLLHGNCLRLVMTNPLLRDNTTIQDIAFRWPIVAKDRATLAKLAKLAPQSVLLQDQVFSQAKDLDLTSVSDLRLLAELELSGDRARQLLDIVIPMIASKDFGQHDTDYMLPIKILRDADTYVGKVSRTEQTTLASLLSEDESAARAFRLWFVALGEDRVFTTSMLQKEFDRETALCVDPTRYGKSSSRAPLHHIHDLPIFMLLDPTAISKSTVNRLSLFSEKPSDPSMEITYESPKGQVNHILASLMLAQLNRESFFLTERGLLRYHTLSIAGRGQNAAATVLFAGRLEALEGEPTESAMRIVLSRSARPRSWLAAIYPHSDYSKEVIAMISKERNSTDRDASLTRDEFLLALWHCQKAAATLVAMKDVQDLLVHFATFDPTANLIKRQLPMIENIDGDRRHHALAMIGSVAQSDMRPLYPLLARQILERHSVALQPSIEDLEILVEMRHLHAKNPDVWSMELATLVKVAPKSPSVAKVVSSLSEQQPKGWRMAIWLIQALAIQEGTMEATPPIRQLAHCDSAPAMLTTLTGLDNLLIPHADSILTTDTLVPFALHGLDSPGQSNLELQTMLGVYGLMARIYILRSDPSVAWKIPY